MNVVVILRFDDMERLVSVGSASTILEAVEADPFTDRDKAVRAALTAALEDPGRFTWMS